MWRRIKSQRNTLAGKAFTKPVVQGTTRQAIGHHMAALGMPQAGGYPKAEWKALTKDKMAVARTARLTHMVAEAEKDGPQRSDEAYMQGATPAGQVGKWTGLVPAFGTRVKYRRSRPGLMDGSAQHCSTSLSGKNQTDVPVQLRNRCKSAMRGLGYGARIERSATSFRLT